jgi:hypothetical protein
MTRKPRPVSYREAMNALQDAHHTLLQILDTPRLPREVRELVLVLVDRLDLLLARDDGHTR